jgi:hypothetical protein
LSSSLYNFYGVWIYPFQGSQVNAGVCAAVSHLAFYIFIRTTTDDNCCLSPHRNASRSSLILLPENPPRKGLEAQGNSKYLLLNLYTKPFIILGFVSAAEFPAFEFRI